jgi:[ribosomal protein S5]-alanine N-acetyltransferase
MNINFKNLKEISPEKIIRLLNNPLVLRYMPLASAHFDENDYRTFIQTKETMWQKHGFGPWAFELNGEFIGWGGLQPEGKDVEIALVLDPKYWGYGIVLYRKIIQYAFENLKLDSLIIFLPSTRKRMKGILKLGFKEEGSQEIAGKLFYKFRLILHPK